MPREVSTRGAEAGGAEIIAFPSPPVQTPNVISTCADVCEDPDVIEAYRDALCAQKSVRQDDIFVGEDPVVSEDFADGEPGAWVGAMVWVPQSRLL